MKMKRKTKTQVMKKNHSIVYWFKLKNNTYNDSRGSKEQNRGPELWCSAVERPCNILGIFGLILNHDAFVGIFL